MFKKVELVPIYAGLSIPFLRNVVESNSPSHAYLFFGPPLSNKETEAFLFAKALLCDSKEERPCHTCRSCRKFDSGNHPDLHVTKVDGNKIKIAQIRTLKDFLFYPPFESSWKIFIITPADSMTEEAAQSLIKTLEEPPPKTVFILLATHPSRLLGTIVSRCQRVPFPPISHEMRVESLMHENGITQESATLLSGLEVPSDEVKEWEELLEVLTKLIFSEDQSPIDIVEKVVVLQDYKEKSDRIARFLFAFYRDMAILKSKKSDDTHPINNTVGVTELTKEGEPEGLLLPKYSHQLSALAQHLSWREIWDATVLIEEARKHLEHSGNFNLIFENLFFKLFAKQKN